jgi:hypothetical protein
MVKQMTIWGVGLKFALFSVLCFVLALVVHVIWYPLFVIQGILPVVLITVSLTLIAIGVPMWVAASKEVDRAFEAGELDTQGVYALCRHPIYRSATFLSFLASCCSFARGCCSPCPWRWPFLPGCSSGGRRGICRKSSARRIVNMSGGRTCFSPGSGGATALCRYRGHDQGSVFRFAGAHTRIDVFSGQ